MSDQDTVDPVLAEMRKQTEHLQAIRKLLMWLLVIVVVMIVAGVYAGGLAAWNS